MSDEIKAEIERVEKQYRRGVITHQEYVDAIAKLTEANPSQYKRGLALTQYESIV